MNHVAAPAVSATSVRRARVPGFHFGLAILMTIIVMLGFWPFYATLFTGGSGAPVIIYGHAAVFTGWLALLLGQTWLVHRRKVGVHQRVGRLGVMYGIGLLLFGTVIAFVVPAMNVTNGTMTLDEAAGFLVLPIGDMLLFGGFFAAGIIRRRDREAHRRLMILAAVALIFPGAARFAFSAGPLAILGVWLLPLFAAMLHDVYVHRRVHRLYWIGAAILVLAFARVGLMEAEPWLVIGRRIISALLPAGFQA
jgi:hypothetical protein